jgi:DNA-binding transcriptional LysR family regulator
MEPNLRQLQAFVHTYHLGSLTKAAERMYVTQAAVSILIRQLEEVLEVRLFDRTSRALKPTLAAQEILPRAESLLHGLDELKADARGLAQRTQGELRFGVTSAVACTLVPGLLKAFRRQYPGIGVAMLDMPPDQLLGPVQREDIEFSIGTPDDTSEDIVLTTLLQDHLCVICCADSPLASRRTVSWKEIGDYETITVRHGNRIRALVEDAMRQIGQAYQPAYEVSFLTTALAFTAQGLGVSVLPSYLIGSFQYSNLVAVRLVDPVVARNLYLVTKKGRSLSPAAAGFLDLLKDSISIHK